MARREERKVLVCVWGAGGGGRRTSCAASSASSSPIVFAFMSFEDIKRRETAANASCKIIKYINNKNNITGETHCYYLYVVGKVILYHVIYKSAKRLPQEFRVKHNRHISKPLNFFLKERKKKKKKKKKNSTLRKAHTHTHTRKSLPRVAAACQWHLEKVEYYRGSRAIRSCNVKKLSLVFFELFVCNLSKCKHF
ncbi:hypothetical protein T492DRAFT_266906 [Pavlovales sp. CCMP2436]|nr:hypothetical protein T492DRAFT_266906 [Pavlovales sp. CCMP2436]